MKRFVDNKALRARWWNYSVDGVYFITISTKNKSPFFGKIKDGEMHLSEIGKIADECWKEIPAHFPFVELGEFIVMPDHVHGIVSLNKVVGTQDFVCPQVEGRNKFGPQSKNLGSVMRGFKVGVTKYSKPLNPNFQWQALYHDKIIRNEEAYNAISKYIRDNPKNYHN